MQNFCTRKSTILYYFFAFAFIYGYCSTISFGSAQPLHWPRAQVTSTASSIANLSPISSGTINSSAKTKNIFSPWTKKNTGKTIESTGVSSEIWSRVRNRFNLNASKSSPLLQRHLNSFAHSQDYINKVIRNASPYFFFILEEVEKRGMPSEIALLPIIESDFNPHCISNKGAAGIWQIMPRMHGLKQNSGYDARKDIYESTTFALDHLTYLHKRFNGNWLLALAAYNSGEGKVQRAISKNRAAHKSTDFWALKLPKETTHFVPKLLALAAIVKSPKQYGVVLPNIPNKPVFARVNTGKAINIAHAAKLVDTTETQLRKLNPGHRNNVSPSGPHHLLVPIHHADNFKQHVNKLPASKAVATKVASAQLIRTKKVKSGTKKSVPTSKSKKSAGRQKITSAKKPTTKKVATHLADVAVVSKKYKKKS